MFTLPAICLLCWLSWGIVLHIGDYRMWGGWGVCMFCVYLLMELNNRFRLLRIRSRMVSCSFLILLMLLPDLHQLRWELLTIPCWALALFNLFAACREGRAERSIFHAFLCLSVASLVYPPILLLGVVFFLCMIFWLHVFRWRSFFAGLLGILCPYWFYMTFQIWQNQLDAAYLQLLAAFRFDSISCAQAPLSHWLSFGAVGLFSVFAMAHFIRYSYNDKIRVRMIYYSLIFFQLALMTFIILQPLRYDKLAGLFVVNSAPIIGHYFALAKGRKWVSFWFGCWGLVFLAVGAYNYFNI